MGEARCRAWACSIGAPAYGRRSRAAEPCATCVTPPANRACSDVGIYFIAYGAWNDTSLALLADFGTSFGGTPWAEIMTVRRRPCGACGRQLSVGARAVVPAPPTAAHRRAPHPTNGPPPPLRRPCQSYHDSNGTCSSGFNLTAVVVDADYSLGASLSDAAVLDAVTAQLDAGALPASGDAVYVVLTSADVDLTSGFCTTW